MQAATELSEDRVRTIIRRTRGGVTEIARRAGVKCPTVSGWLAGKTTSANILRHAHGYALEQLEEVARRD